MVGGWHAAHRRGVRRVRRRRGRVRAALRPAGRTGTRLIDAALARWSVVAHQRDILDEHRRRQPRRPALPGGRGRARAWSSRTGRAGSAATSCGGPRGRDAARPRQHQRHFAWKPGGFLLEGRPVTLAPPGRVARGAVATAVTASGSIAGGRRRPRVAAASRIWVEGRHDAELVEHVWGDDLRELGDRRRADARHRRPRRRGRRRSGPARSDASACSSTTSSPGRRSRASRPPSHDPARADHGPPVRRRVGRHPPARARPRRLAGRAEGRDRGRRDVPRPRRRPDALLAAAAQPRADLRRPAARAGRRRRARSSTSWPRPDRFASGCPVSQSTALTLRPSTRRVGSGSAQTITPQPASGTGPVTGTAGASEAQAVPARPLLDRRRQEVRDGDHGHHRHRLRRGAHGRQPQGVPRRGRRRRYDIDVYGEFLREMLVPILPRTCVLWVLRIVLIGALRPAPPRRLRADGDQPPGPARASTSRRATTSPPTSPAARCAGPGSSCCCSCSSTSPT